MNSANPDTITPRWQEIRGEWKEIYNSNMSADLKGTNNGCLYCHGYHGQQSYMRTATGEEQLCYKCHGGTPSVNYSRSGANVYQQYQNPNTSKHDLTAVKCTSCHGQRGISDRHSGEGYPTSMVVSPKNIKLPWSEASFDDYCNSCHQENPPVETHTSTKLVPHTIKYPPIYTTASANGFVKTGYSAKNTTGDYLVAHKASINPLIGCTTCHGEHAADYPRIVLKQEDSKNTDGTVNEGVCLQCHK